MTPSLPISDSPQTSLTPEEITAADTQTLRQHLSQALTVTARALIYTAAIWKELERRGEDLSSYDLDLGIDPVGVLAATGSLGAVWTEIAPRVAGAAADLEAAGFRGRIFLADGRPYHEAGAGEAAELGAVLATLPLAGSLFLYAPLLRFAAARLFFVAYTFSGGQDAPDWWANRLTLLGIALVVAAWTGWLLRREERLLGGLA